MFNIDKIKEYENKILNMDCIDFLKQCPDKIFDLVLTDPPYGGQFGTGGRQNHKYEDVQKITNWDYAPSQEVFDEIFRVSKNQIIWGGNYFNLPPTRCFNVWKKLTISENFTMAMAEYAWTSFNDNAKVWEFAPQDKERFHITQKPLGLFMKQIELYSEPGDLILDCFSGSGTTAVACHNLKRRFICIERDREYWKASCERLEQAQRQQMLF